MLLKKPRPTTLAPLGATHTSLYSQHLPVGTRLYRVYSQEPGTPDRALAFNPRSDGRTSPVFSASGVADAALYAAVDSPQCAVQEMLYHTVIKKYPAGGVVSSAVFANLQLLALQLTAPLSLISVEALQSDELLKPPNFSQPRTDYSDTQNVAQALYDHYPKTAGICWQSARGLAVVGVFYASRVPANAFKKIGRPLPLMQTEEADYVAQALAHHGIVIAPASGR